MKNSHHNHLPNNNGESTTDSLNTFTIDESTTDNLDIIAMYVLKAIRQKEINNNQKESA